MDVLSSEHFLNTCRTCMSKNPNATTTNPLESIYHHKNMGPVSIQELLNSVIHDLPKIEAEDELPKIICNSCLEKLILCEEFQQMCLRSDSELRNNLASFIAEDMNEFVESLEVNENPPVKDPLQSVDSNVEEEISTYLQLEITEEPAASKESIAASPNSRQESIQEAFTEYDSDSKDIVVSSPEDDNTSSESGESKFSPNEDELQCESQSPTQPKVSRKRHRTMETDSIKSEPSVTSEDLLEPLPKKPNIEKRISAKVTCPICQNVLAHAKSLRKHTKRMHPEEFISLAKPNLEKVEGAEYYQCDECDRCFAKKRYLRKHKHIHRRHEMKKNQTCIICNETFESLVELNQHKSDVHLKVGQDIEKPYVCNICSKGFKIPGSLKEHLRIHSVEVSFLCPECGKAFNSNSNLQQHLLRHTGERRYQCPDCPKRFACSSDLSTHKEVHSKLKPHVCDICGAAFGRNYTLKKHKMRHSGEKPHPCEYCGHRFVTADHMRRHMRTHTGEKPYKCKYCERAFAQSNDLIKHLRSHLGENVYRCEMCPKAFRLLSSLRDHWPEHKNEDEETKERNRLALLKEEENLRIQLKTTASTTTTTTTSSKTIGDSIKSSVLENQDQISQSSQPIIYQT